MIPVTFARWALSAFGLTVGFSAFVAGDWAHAQSAADEKLVIAIGAEPGSVDPVQQTSLTGGNIMYHVTQTLTSAFNETGTIKPLLATSWTGNADSTSFTFNLRPGVKFSDGTPFNAQAVKVNFDRLVDPAVRSPYRSGFAKVKAVVVEDELKVRIDLTEPNSSLPGMLGRYIAGIVSPDSLKKYGNTYDRIVNPIGTGPFIFERYDRASQVVLKRNDAYWGDKPAFGRLEWKIVPEPASREALLKSGGADIALNLPPSGMKSLSADKSLTVLTTRGTNNVYMGINMVGANQPLLKDVRVRQALNYAIDKQGIINHVLFGLADEATSSVSSNILNYCKAGSYSYDPAKAKQLLKEAGAEGMTIKMISPSGRYLQDLQASQAIAASLAAVGVKVEGPTTQDFATYIKTVLTPPEKATFDIALLGAGPPYPDGSETLAQTTSSQIPPAGLNFPGWVNAKFDAAVAKGRASNDPETAAAAYCEAQKEMWQDAPWLFLWTERAYAVTTSKVRNAILLPTGAIFVDKAVKN